MGIAFSSMFLPHRASMMENAETSKYFPATKNWERGIFYTSGLNAPYYISRARNEKAIVIGCSGLNTHYLLDPKDVRKLNEAGITIVWMALPRVKHNGPVMPDYIRLAEEFFTSRQSPAHALIYSNAPRFALTHSTGGQIFFHLLHKPAVAQRLKHIFKSAVHVAPYFDAAHASHDFSLAPFKAIPFIPQRLKEWRPIYDLFQYYMEKNASSRPQDNPVSKAYLWWNALRDFSAPRDVEGFSSTCGQILELQKTGQALTAQFNIEAGRTIPSVFVLGEKDDFACTKTAKHIGQSIGAEIKIAKGGFHDPVRTHPELLEQFIQRVDTCIKSQNEIILQRFNTSVYAREENIPEPDLGDRARLALQRGAGFLYPAAGFLQRFG